MPVCTKCKILYKMNSGKMLYCDSDKDVKIISDTPLTIAPGQFCTLYDETYDVCFGCGEVQINKE